MWKDQQEGRFYFTAINSKGHALGAPDWNTAPPPYYVWDADGQKPLRDDGTPYDFNKALEVVGRARCRVFTNAGKRRIQTAADRCTRPGEAGSMLRREAV